MELDIVNTAGGKTGRRKLPSQFTEEYRPDLIRRAVLSIESKSRQPYGADSRAGMKASANVSRRRRKYRGSYGIGISRVPRKVLSRRGTRMNWVGAEAPGTVGGRRAHSPKAEKKFSQKINRKERRKATRSAIAAAFDAELVEKRGHKVPESYPFLLDDDFEGQSKTKDIIKAFEAVGLKEEIDRCSDRKIRAGKGTMRNRKYKRRKSILIVVSGDCQLKKAARNIQGVNVVTVKRLNAKQLAPGAMPGRISFFTKKAVEIAEKEGLFA